MNRVEIIGEYVGPLRQLIVRVSSPLTASFVRAFCAELVDDTFWNSLVAWMRETEQLHDTSERYWADCEPSSHRAWSARLTKLQQAALAGRRA